MIKNNLDVDKLVQSIVEGISDVKGQEINILDLRDIDGAVCDFFVICEGTSNTHVNAIVNSVRRRVIKDLAEKPWNTEGEENGLWVLMDYVNVVVHVFQKHIREYYDIESLWGDAKAIVVESN